MQLDIEPNNGELFRCQKNKHKDTWITKDGKVLIISKLTTEYIKNAIELFGVDNVPRTILEEYYNRTQQG